MTECKYARNYGADRVAFVDIRCMGTKELDPCPGFDKCPRYTPNYKTNEDWLKSLDKSEFAWFMAKSDGPCKCCDTVRCNDTDCYNAWKRWLGLEHKEIE